MKKTSFEKVPSLIKWSGSKRLIAQDIQKYIPTNFSRYFEPFLGGGSILYNNTHSESFANDISEPLIDLWLNVKNHPNQVIDRYRKDWEKLQSDFPNYFYTVRSRFNTNQNGFDLLFLSRTAVNGIIRFNKKGEFNNSIHLSRRGMNPETFEKIVMKWSEKIQNTEFYNVDYKVFLQQTKRGDFVYLDPPYLNSKNRYTENIDIDELIDILYELNNKKVKWALSFDGIRGSTNLEYPLPNNLYKRVVLIDSGNSKVGQVLNKKNENVKETLYMNY